MLFGKCYSQCFNSIIEENSQPHAVPDQAAFVSAQNTPQIIYCISASQVFPYLWPKMLFSCMCL